MDFKEKRVLQKTITEKISKLESGDLSFKEKRDIQKEITADFVKLGETPPVIPEPVSTLVYDKLKAGDFINLPANEFIKKLKEAAKELGIEDSLTMDIIGPVNTWKEKREGIANEGVEQEDDTLIDDFINQETAPESTDGHEDGELEEIALEDVKTKLNIGDKFKLKGKVSNIDSQESSKKTGNYNSINIEFPFNNDWKKSSYRFSAYFSLKDGEANPFKIDDEITLEAELKEIKGKKPKKEGDAPLIYYGISFKSPEGFKDTHDDYVNFASEKSVLKHMIGEVPATESSESGDPEMEIPAGKAETPEKPEGDSEKEATEDPATESVAENEEIEFDYDDDVEINPEGDFSELVEEGLASESALNPDIATEKAKDVDEKLWKYAKKIVLKARFDKKPSGDNEKDNEAITDGKAWGFVQDRYQKLVSGKIKARKRLATESADQSKIEEPKPAEESTEETTKETPATESTEIEVELVINETEVSGDPSKPEDPPAIESVEEIEDDEEIIIG